MKIIFLDIDGVLNSDTWEKSKAFKNGVYPSNSFDPFSVQLLNNIINETQAKVVLTSTWRLKFTLQEIKDPKKHKLIVACTAVWAKDVRLIDNMILKGEKHIR